MPVSKVIYGLLFLNTCFVHQPWLFLCSEQRRSNALNRLQRLKVKGRHLYTATYMNMTSSGLQCEVAYWPAMTLGGEAQVAAAHCPNERTWTPQYAAISPAYAPASRTMAFTPQCSPATTRYF